MADGLRSIARHLVEATLVRTGVADAALRRRSTDVAILAYHNIVPRGEVAFGEHSLHLDQGDFGVQLDRLLETHRIVGLDDLLDGDPDSGGPRAVITFDDAYLGALTAGVEELTRRGLEATVFVNPGALEWEGFWWDRLAEPGGGLMPGHVRSHALGKLGGAQEAILAWAAREGVPQVTPPPFARAAPLSVLRDLPQDTVRLASHTWSHPRLPFLSGAPLRDELERPKAWLKENFERVSAWISYPYGEHSHEVESIAAGLYAGGLRVTGGLASFPAPDPMAVPRINISRGMSVEGFVLRISGLR